MQKKNKEKTKEEEDGNVTTLILTSDGYEDAIAE